jgi:arsenate reductase
MRFALLIAAAFMAAHVPAEAAEHQTRILVLCSGNSARSQMAEGVLKSLDQTLDVQSAGITPAARVNPHAIQAMKEIGIDISGEHPKPVQQFVKQSFDYVITVCDDADKNCPVFSGKVGTRTHIGFPDPPEAKGTEEQIMKVFREVRDDIRTKFSAYYRETIAKTAHQTR